MVWPVDRPQRAQSPKRRVHFNRGRLRALLDERVQQHRFAFKDREKHASNATIESHAHFPELRPELAYQRHAYWPAELHFANLVTDSLAIVNWQTSEPLPNRLGAPFSPEEPGR